MALAGCRVTEDDIHRWEMKQHGPEKLQAVLFYPKYDDNLRVEAAISLIRMKPRGYTDPFDGQTNGDGIEGLVKTLARVPAEQRTSIIASLVPAIINELKKQPPVAQGDQKAPPDPSFAFKDAAYALLTYEQTALITDDTLRTSLKTALVEWAMADFEIRLENRTQKYGMEQLLKYIGSDSIVGLPKLMTRDARNLDKMAGLVAEFGTDATKEEASKQLTAIATYIVSDEWTKVKTPILQQANKEGKAQFDLDAADCGCKDKTPCQSQCSADPTCKDAKANPAPAAGSACETCLTAPKPTRRRTRRGCSQGREHPVLEPARGLPAGRSLPRARLDAQSRRPRSDRLLPDLRFGSEAEEGTSPSGARRAREDKLDGETSGGHRPDHGDPEDEAGRRAARGARSSVQAHERAAARQGARQARSKSSSR